MTAVTQKQVTGTVTQLWGASASAGPVTVINLDTAVTINIGYVSTIAAGQSNSFPLGPGASAVFDGTQGCWAVAPTGQQAKAGIVPGGGGYSPGSLSISGPVTATISGPVTAEISGPVTVDGTVGLASGTTVDIGGTTDVNIQNATVDVTGAGGYIQPGDYNLVLNDTSTHLISPGSTYTTPVFDMRSYQSYAISVLGFCNPQNVAGAPLTAQVLVQYWADAAGTVLIDSERWWIWLGNLSTNAEPVSGSGPLRAGHVSISIICEGISTSFTVTGIALYGAGRSLAKSIWQQSPPASMTSGGPQLLTSKAPNWPVPGDDGILAAESNNNNLSVSTSFWLPMPLFSGQIYMRGLASSALGHDFVVCTAAGLQYGQMTAGASCPGILWDAGSLASEAVRTLECGNAPMFFVIAAGSTVPPPTFSFSAQGIS